MRTRSRYSADEWNELFNTDSGQDVERILEPFVESGPHLTRPQRQLRRTVKALLQMIDEHPRVVKLVSATQVVHGARRLREQLPTDMWERMRVEFVSGFSASVLGELWWDLQLSSRFGLKAAIAGGTPWSAVRQGVRSSLIHTDWSTFSAALDDEIWDGVRHHIANNVQSVLTHRVAAALFEPVEPSAIAFLDTFLAMFESGNIPLGRWQDNGKEIFLVLTA